PPRPESLVPRRDETRESERGSDDAQDQRVQGGPARGQSGRQPSAGNAEDDAIGGPDQRLHVVDRLTDGGIEPGRVERDVDEDRHDDDECRSSGDGPDRPPGAHFFDTSFSATASRMSALNAFSSIFSPSWKSIARRVFPSRLELKRCDGSLSDAPLA